jgi:formylglycine-generating enzyme required for sulfatase activity
VALPSGAQASHPFVYETPLEFISTGDFNGDGLEDALLLSRSKGRVRIGYNLGGGIYDWADWRESGVKSVSGVSVGKLFDPKHDSIAATSADVNQLAVLDAVNSTKPTDPVSLPVTVIGPNLVFTLDIPGEGNTPLADLIVPSTLNPDDNPYKMTFYRNGAGKFSPLTEFPVPSEGAHGNVVVLKPGGKELVMAVLTDASGTRLQAGAVENGRLASVLCISNVPAGADYVIGNFRGANTRDIIVYNPDSPEIALHPVTEAGGTFQTGAPKQFTLDGPVKQLVVAEGAKRSQLLAVLGTNQAAELLSFAGEGAPVKVQELLGATNKLLHGVIALKDAVILFSTITNSGPGYVVSHYQVYQREGDKYTPGSYGGLPPLDDRDDATVPDIHARIVASHPAKAAADMKAYTNTIPGTEVSYSMVAIPGGEFLMGSPAGESGRKPTEGPQHRVKLSPFWMGQFEVTWDLYAVYMNLMDEQKLRQQFLTDTNVDAISDAVTRPTRPYVDMSFGMGKAGFPAIAMTQHAANKFCHWLSARTGHFYRLPTEAEWEYACRAGTTTAYSFGNDASSLTNYAWYFDNSNDKYQRVGRRLPNPWGLFDMHGNVREWTLDQYDEDYYASFGQGVATDPWNKATKPYPHSTRGGSWYDDAAELRSATRIPSNKQWKMTDPQLPKSRWWLSDATWIGIRLVRPLKVPSPDEMVKYWTSGVDKE